MIIEIEMSCKDYLKAMKFHLDSFMRLGQRRFTGIVLGKFFSVTHHAGYEFNRRVTNERNSAIGYVKKTDVGTEVRCVLLKGVTTPQGLIGSFLLSFFTMLFVIFIENYGAVSTPLPDGWLKLCIVFSSVMTVVIALVSALCDSVTARGEQGEEEIMSLLLAPHNRSAYLNDH